MREKLSLVTQLLLLGSTPDRDTEKMEGDLDVMTEDIRMQTCKGYQRIVVGR